MQILKNDCPSCGCKKIKEGSYKKYTDCQKNIHEEAVCNNCDTIYSIVYYEK